MVLKGKFTFVSQSVRHFDSTDNRAARDVTVVNVLDEETGKVQTFYCADFVEDHLMGDSVELTFNVYMGRDNAYHVTLKSVDACKA